ncbi:MAG TPA: aminotransferase class V-fold PLP-dependent enzyme [Roseiflexaceae bacterium]|nr:aminotransferase class V-fold PLP-dependent enzyme [Roseiflexaceae bacterium]
MPNTPEFAAALEAFERAYPSFTRTRALDELRAREYARLDAQGHVYLDYTGGGLYAESQLREHMAMLGEQVFGNPHSKNPTSQAMTQLVERARRFVLEYFNAAPEEYAAIFTPNASGALRLVGEAYPFGPGGHFLLTADNHNSVNGIREFAWRAGADVTYVLVTPPEMRVDAGALREQLGRAQGGHRLLAYPAQSNFTGVQHALEWIGEAQQAGWDVLLDAAAFVPTNRLDLDAWRPDFVSLSFYKMFGYPTGVGCLLARHAALAKLRRPWFAGGTISIVSVQGRGWHYLLPGEAGFEDGTVNYLALPAVEIGLRHMARVGVELIHERVMCLTGWLLAQLRALRHANGAPLVRVYGPADCTARGGNIAFNLFDPYGRPHDFRRVEALAAKARISLRTGCFCNPGAGEIAHHVTRDEMAQCFTGDKPVSFEEFYELLRPTGKHPSTVRISVGLATNFADVYSFVQFARGFLDAPAEDAPATSAPQHARLTRDAG